MITLKETLLRFKKAGVNFSTALDVGAHWGEWCQQFREIYPEVPTLSVEANPDNIDRLRQVNPNFINCCLGDKSQKRTFFLPDPTTITDNTGASLYKEGLKYYDNAKEVVMEVVTLDSLGVKPEFLKLDVQGAELDVLRGGLETLKGVKVIQAEISLVQYNLGAPDASEVICHLRENGFSMESVFDVRAFNGRVFVIDAMFIRADLDHLRRDLSFINDVL